MTGKVDDPDSAFDLTVAASNAPMWIVTTIADGQRAGCLVGFSAQVSIEPRRFVACLSKRNHTYGVASRADHLAVHLLSDESLALAQLFGSETGFDLDKFEHSDWQEGPHSLPILTATAGWFIGEILNRTDFGDHVGFLLAPTAARAPTPGIPPLRYAAVADLVPGNQP
ncbi:flavin reductase family protein [Nocardia niigatensis]|uniref:flavin reductase family protein n=1 Tax=Nocardia niigatensis TaxID=209249 RepID=UPI00031D23EB|nr:flavin reductase family protein [Nocardia niigatensis]